MRLKGKPHRRAHRQEQHLSLFTSSRPNRCYIGKRYLETAIRAAPESLDIKVRWRPFQLDASAPVAGVNKLDMYHQKFGAARVNTMLPMMSQVPPPPAAPPLAVSPIPLRRTATSRIMRLQYLRAQATPT